MNSSVVLKRVHGSDYERVVGWFGGVGTGLKRVHVSGYERVVSSGKGKELEGGLVVWALVYE